jgi:uncharacterized protein YggE
MRTLIALTATLALALAGCAGGQVPTARTAEGASLAGVSGTAPAEGVTVAGVGRVTGRPDVLRVTVGVGLTRPTVQQALDEANAAADRVLTALRDRGVAETDVQTREFSVAPEFRYPQDGGAPTITGYTVRNLVEAKLRDLDRTGEILSAVVSAGGDAARVENVAFSLEDNAELLQEARAAAFADAKAKAEQYARLAERPLGALISLSEATSAPPVPVPFDQGAGRALQEAAPVPVNPGEQEVSVTVTAVWALG